MKTTTPKQFRHMVGCKSCALCKTRKKVVVGRGPITAKIMFVGEAPGADEDESGIPFVGKAGKKLSEMLEQAGIEESDIYITNTVKCRPPQNREPAGIEVKKCKEHLNLQLRVIQPEYIVTLGNTALQYFCPNVKITTVHGKVRVTKRGMKIFPIIHPAAIFRTAEYEQLIVDDLLKLKKLIAGVNRTQSTGDLVGVRVME
jgi:uracil-DNA glycosylase family 4